ncbi:MAG: o-succinylbenzoate synthase, partial [Promethearchaeota archaeon]
IGRAFNLHLQTLPGFTLPGDTSETSRYFTEDIVEPSVTIGNDGFIEIPKGHGIGVRVIQERLRHHTTFSEKFHRLV